MSEKEKKSTAPATSDAKPESKQRTDKATDSKPKKAEAKPVNAPVPEVKQRKCRSSLLGGRSKPAAFPVDILARRTDTNPVVLGALKAAYGWTDRTTLTRTEFMRLHDAWLKRPVKEV